MRKMEAKLLILSMMVLFGLTQQGYCQSESPYKTNTTEGLIGYSIKEPLKNESVQELKGVNKVPTISEKKKAYEGIKEILGEDGASVFLNAATSDNRSFAERQRDYYLNGSGITPIKDREVGKSSYDEEAQTIEQLESIENHREMRKNGEIEPILLYVYLAILIIVVAISLYCVFKK